MLEMVIAKGDARIARYYDQLLVPEALKPLGYQLRQRFLKTLALVNRVKKQTRILQDNPQFRTALTVRNPYTDPLHYLQAELMRRERQSLDVGGSVSPMVEMALKVTMAGIAAGLRNTG